MEKILEYARSRGVKDPKVERDPTFGYYLVGYGKDELGFPLVWKVADECGIAWGGGSKDRHQIIPERFKHPNESKS